MEKKICSKCEIEKPLIEFYTSPNTSSGYRPTCKLCMKKYQEEYQKNKREKRNKIQRAWRAKNKDKVSNYRKKYYDENPDKYRKISQKYRDENPEKIKEYNKKKYNLNKESERKRNCIWRVKNEVKNKNRLKLWREDNKVRILNYKRDKYNNDDLYRLTQNVRNRLNQFIKSKNISKTNTTFNIIGCSPEFLKEHLEKQFIGGMSWENRSDWHIDHIIPLSSAETEERIYELCHYTNLQPLWAEDNMKKGNKI